MPLTLVAKLELGRRVVDGDNLANALVAGNAGTLDLDHPVVLGQVEVGLRYVSEAHDDEI